MTSPAEPPGPTLIRRASALAGGLSDNELRRARQRGTLTVVTRGVYLRTTEADELDGAARHVAAVLAVLPRLVGGPVVSHVSAAVVHGLPFWHTEMPAVHVTRDRSVKARRGPALQTHRASLHEDEVVIVAGLPVTSVARTVLDCARTLPFENAVVLADAALHRGLVTPAGLTAQLRRHARIPGARLVAAVVCFADGRSGHVGTSRSRVVLHRAGLPAPELRFPVVGGQGESLGCADFAYPASRVLGEFVPLDRNACPLGAAQTLGGSGLGRSGLGGSGLGGSGPAGQCRDERVQAAGWRIIRWTWSDLTRPVALIGQLSAALQIPAPIARP